MNKYCNVSSCWVIYCTGSFYKIIEQITLLCFGHMLAELTPWSMPPPPPTPPSLLVLESLSAGWVTQQTQCTSGKAISVFLPAFLSFYLSFISWQSDIQNIQVPIKRCDKRLRNVLISLWWEAPLSAVKCYYIGPPQVKRLWLWNVITLDCVVKRLWLCYRISYVDDIFCTLLVSVFLIFVPFLYIYIFFFWGGGDYCT